MLVNTHPWLRSLGLLAPLVVSACLLNPQSEDPVRGSADMAGGGASPGVGGSSTGTGGMSAGVGGTSAYGGSTAAGGFGTDAGVPAGVDLCAATAPAIPDGNAELLPDDGNIRDTSGTGIVGTWFTLASTGAEVQPAEAEQVVPVEGEVCFSGTVPQALDGDYATYWGAAIGFDLCALPEDTSDLPEPLNGLEPSSQYTAAECGITVNGISFDLTGDVPADLAIVFDERDRAEDAYYAYDAAEAEGAFCAAVQSRQSDNAASSGLVAGGDVQAIRFQVLTNETAPTSFDFCISNLSVW